MCFEKVCNLPFMFCRCQSIFYKMKDQQLSVDTSSSTNQSNMVLSSTSPTYDATMEANINTM